MPDQSPTNKSPRAYFFSYSSYKTLLKIWNLLVPSERSRKPGVFVALRLFSAPRNLHTSEESTQKPGGRLRGGCNLLLLVIETYSMLMIIENIVVETSYIMKTSLLIIDKLWKRPTVRICARMLITTITLWQNLAGIGQNFVSCLILP